MSSTTGNSDVKPVSMWRHARAWINFPGVLVFGIPYIILAKSNKTIENQIFKHESDTSTKVRKIAGIVCFGFGLFLAIESNKLFHRLGNGTGAPYDPPTKLVTTGVYGYVRNPMLIGAYFMVAGQAIFGNSISVLKYLSLFVIGTSIMHKYHEEPALTQTFGNEYVEYKNNVPFIIPRLTPWKPRFEVTNVQ